MHIRKFNENDAEEASKLICTTLMKVNTKDSPLFAIKEQCSEYSPEEIKKLSKKREIFVAVEKNKIIGTAAIEKNYICSVFMDSSMIGKGIGKQLMKNTESILKDRGYKKSILTSGPTALGFYKKLGYKEIKKEYQRGQLTGIEMKKKL